MDRLIYYGSLHTDGAGSLPHMDYEAISPRGGEIMTNYEVMFILDPASEDAEREAFTERVQTIITDGNGTVGKVDVWGMRKLAYPIRKKNEGYYVLVEFQAGTDLPKELDRRLKIADICMRHIIVNKDAE
jgi:small subunit ribosomal protein S6